MTDAEQLPSEAKYVTLDALYKNTTFPSVVTRIKALFIDFCLVLFVFTATSLFIDNVVNIPDFVKGFILVFMIYLYDPLLIHFTGRTLGQKVMGVKVCCYENPEMKLTLWQAIGRFFIKAALGWVSFVAILGNRHKRGIHDMASGSIVLFK